VHALAFLVVSPADGRMLVSPTKFPGLQQRLVLSEPSAEKQKKKPVVKTVHPGQHAGHPVVTVLATGAKSEEASSFLDHFLSNLVIKARFWTIFHPI
jgi:hypothetical protein